MGYKIGAIFAKIILIIFPIAITYLYIKNRTLKKRKIIYTIFILSWFLYVIPIWFRENTYNELLLYYFGFLPNLGASISIPLAFLYNKELTYKNAKLKLLKSSTIILLVILGYELLQLLPNNGTFDKYDILMTIFGFLTVNILFRTNKKIFEK